jgi:hypothetical protein
MSRGRGAVAGVCAGFLLAACTGGGSGSPGGKGGDGVVTVSAGQASSACDNGLIAHHVGLAGGAVHGLVWKPFSAGAFGDRASGRQESIKVGARAAVMASRQLTRVGTLLASCPSLARLQRPVADAATRTGFAAQQLTGGTVDAATLTAAESAVSAVEAQSQGLGITIVEREPTRAELAALASATS